ncbi:2-C-methyl-D-erythritol 4-phosphate cytidylyltransferase / 2-C-methyl-D-erythritol 2 [Parelusimicrobium proximum]|uniref:2-C-methyl-D-erythritol 4-phosphate cytidylyltransferase n=1 Tax=Parelusimicrobium proximum TaxID=3228953 RepID=UPI003D17CD3E
MPTSSGITAIIVAGGDAKRMGRPKQLIPVGGKPALYRSIEAFITAGAKDIIVVSKPEILEEIKSVYPHVTPAESGSTRINSVINGLGKVKNTNSIIAVHDGARPLVSSEIILKCCEAAAKYGAAVPAAAVKDTIKEVEGDEVKSTPDRSSLYAVQTPQCYQYQVIKTALDKYGSLADATDESQLVEKTGVKVKTVMGDYKNIKITTPEDIAVAEALLSDGKVQRTGFGFDLHRLEEGRKLFIGGLQIDHPKGFVGHSDGDVVLHAICDAALGAACLGEIGMLFPPTDKKIEGISSVTITERVLEMLKEHGAEIIHIDATIITEEPKMKPLYEDIRHSLNKIFKIGLENISFKSKSHERIGDIGEGKAAMCHTVVTIRK